MQTSSKTIWLWLVINTFRWLWIGFLVDCSREMLSLLLGVHLIIMLLFCNSENIIGLIERGLVNLCQLLRFVNFFWNEDLPARRKKRTCALLGDICRMIGKPSLIPAPPPPPPPPPPDFLRESPLRPLRTPGPGALASCGAARGCVRTRCFLSALSSAPGTAPLAEQGRSKNERALAPGHKTSAVVERWPPLIFIPAFLFFKGHLKTWFLKQFYH